MRRDQQSVDSHVAFGAAAEGFDAVRSSLAIIGRYFWNLQMKLLLAIGVMPLFRAYWWLFLVVAVLLLAFVNPLGIAFTITAFCATQMEPTAKANFIVPLKHEENTTPVMSAGDAEIGGDVSPRFDELENVQVSAAQHHTGYLATLNRDLEDKEIAATALGAFAGTVQVTGLKLSDFDMHTHGAAFVVARLANLGRMEEVDPDRIAEVTEDAMTSSALAAIRLGAGRFAYSRERAMRDGPDQPTS